MRFAKPAHTKVRNMLHGFGAEPPSANTLASSFGHNAGLMPGNLGALADVIWPYFFTFEQGSRPVILEPGQGSDSFITITQEAAFIWMATSKIVFKRIGLAAPYQYVAIDPLAADTDNSQTPGLKYTLTDPQSSRTFHSNPQPVDGIGPAEFPSVLPTPQLLLPNSNLQIRFQNDNTGEVYIPKVTLFGYRVRIDALGQVLATTKG